LVSFRIDVSDSNSRVARRYSNEAGYDRYRSMGRKPTSSELKSESEACWVSKGTPVSVSGINISQGMIYVGSRLRSQNYGADDNCLINPKLKVATSSDRLDAESIGYWPSYSGLSPKARREYLLWLSNGAKDPDANISFAFLYFYGLERRLFLDAAFEETTQIIDEMKRLQSIYSDNYSLERYVDTALSFAAIIDPKPAPVPVLEIPKKPSWELPVSVVLYIGKKLKSGEPLTNDDILLWYLNHPEKHLRTPAKRLEEEFISLLKIKLEAVQPAGPKVRTPKSIFNPEYSSCSSSFSTKFGKHIQQIPDISKMKAPINLVQKLADESMGELDKLSRLLGRKPDLKESFKAISLLPPQLVSKFGGAKVRETQTWLSKQINGEAGIFTFEEIIRKTTDFDGKKVTKSIHKDVDSFLDSLGWSMIPKPHEIIGTPKPEIKVLLAKTVSKRSFEDKPSNSYLLAVLTISLGAYIAHSDNRLLDVEVALLIQKVKTYPNITGEERSRLYEVIKWLSIQTPDIKAINRKIKSGGSAEKQAFAELAIAVAAADGKIEPGEVRALESVYQSLGFDKKDLYSGLHSLGTPQAKRDKTTTQSDTNTSSPSDINARVNLDMTRVQSTLADTQKASALLASIFEEEADSEVDTTDEEHHSDGLRFQGLDVVHAQFLSELLEREEWPRDDFVRLASSLNLLPDGAMETINEWAFEKYDEPVLEDGEHVDVYADLVNET